MADLRIVDAPEIPTENITGEEKLPTGGSGNYSITLDSVADYTKTKKDLADNTSVDGKVNGVRQELDAHLEDLLNPHQVTKGQIGLGNVDNTADADKPVSNSTQAAIISAVSPKADKTYVDNALASKSDKTYVDAQLALKANKADVYTKSETYTKQESNDLVNNSISTALTPVNSSLDLAKRGVLNHYDSLLTYNSGERVVLANGDIVKSTIDGNTNDPNVDMTGWIKTNDASQIFYNTNPLSSYLRYITPSVFGIVHSTSLDQASKLQSMIYFAVNNGLTIIGEKITVGVKSQIIIPPTLHALWQGLKIKYLEGFSGGTGSLVSLEKGESTANWIKGSPLDNIVIEGTAGNAASATMTLDGLYVGSTAMQTSDLAFNNIKISGFRDCLNIKGPSSYMLTFNNAAIGVANRRGVSYTASSDSGENIRFFGGSIYNCANPTFNAVGYYQDPASSNLDITFYGTSFDYCDISAVQNHSGLTLISCHFENNCNNPHIKLYRTVGKLRTSLRVKGGNFGGGPWTNHPFGMPVEDSDGRPCLVELNGGAMNILIDDVECGGYRVSGQKTEIVKNATGEAQRRIKISPILDAGSAVTDSVPCSLSNSLLNKLYVEANGGLIGWGRGSSWVTSTDSIAYDTGSRKFEATAESGFLSQDLSVTSGQTIVVKTWIKTSGLTQGYATIRLEFYNSAGDKILDHIAPRQADKNTAVFKEVSTYLQAPQGATKVVYKDYVTGLQATGTKEVWFSGERVWLY